MLRHVCFLIFQTSKAVYDRLFWQGPTLLKKKKVYPNEGTRVRIPGTTWDTLHVNAALGSGVLMGGSVGFMSSSCREFAPITSLAVSFSISRPPLACGLSAVDRHSERRAKWSRRPPRAHPKWNSPGALCVNNCYWPSAARSARSSSCSSGCVPPLSSHSPSW